MATETTYTKDELEELSRKDLQNEAKRAGIKANLKSSAIVAQLLEFYTSGIPFGTPLTTPVKLRSPAKRSSLLATPMRLSPVGKTPRTSTIRRGRRVTKTPARARPKMQKLPVRDQDEIEAAIAASFKKFLSEYPSERPTSGASLHCLLQQVKGDDVLSVTEKDDEHTKDVDLLWLADLGSIRFVATLVASLLNDIIVHAMMAQGAIERDGFALRFEQYEQAIMDLIPGELGKIALEECQSIQREVNTENVNEFGLILDYNQARGYFNKLGVEVEVQDAVILTAVAEYVVSEIWEVCQGKTLPDGLTLIQKEHVFKSINDDDELHQIFKEILTDSDQQTEENQQHTDKILKLIATLPKDAVPEPADEAVLKEIESSLFFEMYPALKTLLRYSNGIPSFGIDSCKAILESITYYSELAIIYAQANWIPLRCVTDGVSWDCLDINTSSVIRFSVIPDDLDEAESVVEEIADYSIVARSLEEYIERTRESSDHCADALNVLLREVDPIGSEMIQIYLGQDEDEEGEVPSSND